jgi:hypothetical protein
MSILRFCAKHPVALIVAAATALIATFAALLVWSSAPRMRAKIEEGRALAAICLREGETASACYVRCGSTGGPAVRRACRAVVIGGARHD